MTVSAIDQRTRTAPLTYNYALTHLDDLLAIDGIWGADEMLASFPRKWELSRVLEIDKKPVAFAIVSMKETGPHLHRLMVNRHMTRQGLGSALLASLPRPITLKVGTRNHAAQRFYMRHGFEFEAPHVAMRSK